jgi:hypothetical protein
VLPSCHCFSYYEPLTDTITRLRQKSLIFSEPAIRLNTSDSNDVMEPGPCPSLRAGTRKYSSFTSLERVLTARTAHHGAASTS